MADTPETLTPDEVEGPTCVQCGCTEDDGCEGGCWWLVLEPPICSACVPKVTLTPSSLEQIVDYTARLHDMLASSADRIEGLTEQNQILVNLLTALIIRDGGKIQIRRVELLDTANYRLDSKHDIDRDEQVLTITRVDPKTGEDQPSRLIVPGRLPLTVL